MNTKHNFLNCDKYIYRNAPNVQTKKQFLDSDYYSYNIPFVYLDPPRSL